MKGFRAICPICKREVDDLYPLNLPIEGEKEMFNVKYVCLGCWEAFRVDPDFDWVRESKQ